MMMIMLMIAYITCFVKVKYIVFIMLPLYVIISQKEKRIKKKMTNMFSLSLIYFFVGITIEVGFINIVTMFFF